MNTVQMTPVQLTDGSQAIRLETPYHPSLPARLRQLGGKWNDTKRVWYLPADVQPQIRALCQEIFSVDPMAPVPADLVNVQIDISSSRLGDTFWAFGRSVLRRPGRDSEVRPGDGVSILSGGFAGRGGSARYPSIGEPAENTVVLVRDVPRQAVAEFADANPDMPVTIIEKAADNVAYEQAKAMAAQLGAIVAKLTEEQKREVIGLLADAMK